MEKKLLLIYNPHSGKGQIGRNLSGIVQAFVKGGYEVTVHPTQAVLDGGRKARECGGAYDCVVCCGGDGTLSEVLAGISGIPDAPPLGYIPAGTTNDFAATLHLARNPVEAAEDIVKGVVFHCDVGRFNRERPFIYVASFGVFTDVAYSTPQQNKNMFGRVAYFLEGIKELSAIPSFHLRAESGETVLEDDFIFGSVTNSTSLAGFQSFRPEDVELDDGLFEVLLIRRPQNLLEMHGIVTALMRQSKKCPSICALRTAELRINAAQAIPWTLDGEFGGELSQVVIENQKQAVRLLLPEIWGSFHNGAPTGSK